VCVDSDPTILWNVPKRRRWQYPPGRNSTDPEELVGRPTIHDVAGRANVSKSLVSLVLQGSPNVADEKRERVLRAIADLRYLPNLMARGLAARRTRTIGVLLSDLHNPFFAEVVDGIDAAAAELGYGILVNTGSLVATREAQALNTFLELRTDGLILAGTELPTSAIVEASLLCPVVLVAPAFQASSVDTVTNDDRAGAELAVEHLHALGHRRIAAVDGGRAAGARGRVSGYRRAMTRLGLGEHVRVASGTFTEEGGYQGAQQLLRSGPVPSAISAANDLAAIGVLNAIEEIGLRVPGDISLVGYDNTFLASLRHVSLTTINQPRSDMGRMAVSCVLERIEGRRELRHVVLAPQLVVRDTTAPPRAVD
jgi:DNA-binding LacI/PurR family transcriptional regulator